MVACIDFFEMSEICRPKFIIRHSTFIRHRFDRSFNCQYNSIKILTPYKERLNFENTCIEAMQKTPDIFDISSFSK
jgi:hypothetical protein